MSVTLWTAQSPMSWLKAEAPLNIMVHGRNARGVPRADVLVEGGGAWNIKRMLVTPEVSHAPISSLKEAAAELQ